LSRNFQNQNETDKKLLFKINDSFYINTNQINNGMLFFDKRKYFLDESI